MKIGDLFVTLGIKADTQTLNKVQGGIKSLRNNLVLVQAAFAGAAFALDRFTNDTIKSVVSLQNLNNQTDLSIEKLQQWQQAGQLSDLNLSADQVSQSIANLQKNLTAIKLGAGDIKPFQLLGIDVANKNAFQVLDQVRESIKGLDSTTASSLISQLGLDPSFINILRLSKEEFQALGENIFLSEKQRKEVIDLGTAFTSLKLRLKALKDQAVARIAPELKKLITNFFKWLKDNGEKVVDTITSIARGFGSFLATISQAAGLLSDVISRIVGVDNGLKLLAGTALFLTASFSPLLAILALFVAVLDDIAVFRKGGESLIGEALNGLGISDEIGKAFIGGFIDGLKFIAEGIGIIFGDIKNLVVAVKDVIVSVFDIVAEKIASFIGLIGDAKEVINKISSPIKKGINASVEFARDVASNAEIFGDKIASKIAGVFGVSNGSIVATGGLSPVPINNSNSSNAITNNITMNITGGGNPQETAAITIDNLKNTQALINNGGF